MRNIPAKTIALLLLTMLPMFAGRVKDNGNNPTPPDTTSLVASVTPGTAAGTGTITINGDTPFTVTAGTTIVVDGNAAKLTDVHAGLLVVSRTAADSSVPEIDLKTVPPPATKKNKNSNS